MSLQSQLFRGDPKLEAAAVSDSAHIVSGATGEHVRKIQLALIQLDGAAVDPDGKYGPATAAAVLAYKRKRNIINRTYQTQADNIVGKMTMASLDSEILKRPPAEPVQIKPLSNIRITPTLPRSVTALLDDAPRFGLNFAIGSDPILVTPPLIHPQVALELHRNSSGRFEVTNGVAGTIQVKDPDIAKIRAQSGQTGTSFVIKKDPEPFQVFSGNKLGRTLIIASANGLSAALVVVVKPFRGPPIFHPGVHHDHTPCRKFEEILHHPNNSGGTGDSLKNALDRACAVLAVAADSPFPLPHGPELLVAAARAILFVKRPLASTHLEFYLNGKGKDFVEDNNIKDWITRDSGIRKRLKREIFPPGAKPRVQGEFFFSQNE
ncbi:MAG: peptidoglycan-binding domain-containing protein, partial [Nitrosospira sp.]